MNNYEEQPTMGDLRNEIRYNNVPDKLEEA
jgi:hypothetical protein